MNRKVIGLASLLALGTGMEEARADYARRYIHIVGSSTVLPYAKAVGEKLAKSGKITLPRMESTGTGGGIKLFCEGVGSDYPDIVNASRPMKPKEREECRADGIEEIEEVKIGYSGLVLAQSKKAPTLALSRKELRAALAKWVPDASGKLVPNPNTTWKQINPALPDTHIDVLGPPKTSGSYDALVDMIEEACSRQPWTAPGSSEPTPDMLRKCRTLRDDGAYVETRENDEDLVFRISDNPVKVAIFDYKLLSRGGADVRAVAIDEVMPTYDSIAAKTYPGTRPLFMYVKRAHLDRIPGLKDYLAEVTSAKALGDKGYLTTMGLIPAVTGSALTGGSEPAAKPVAASKTKTAKPTAEAKPAKKQADTQDKGKSKPAHKEAH